MANGTTDLNDAAQSELPAITVFPEMTPNPQSLRFSASRAIAESSAEFKSIQEAARSPLAKKLFGFPWTQTVFIGTDFVTVTKQDWVDWETLTEPLTGLIQEHIDRGEAVLHPLETQTVTGDDTPEVALIKRVLNEEIRPAVALDGGDIVFHKFEDNVVYLYMQGSCAGCPSSTATLKMGIETRLKNVVPSIRDVIAL